MTKKVKQFGYTNIVLLVVSSVIIQIYVDFQELSVFDYVLLVLYAVVILIHLIRLIILFKSR